MHIRHQPVIVTDGGDAAILRGAAIEAAIFADGIAVADLKPGRLAGIFLVLIGFTERDEMKNAIVTANFCAARDDAMVADTGALINFHIAINDGVRADADTRTQPRAWVNDGGGVDAHQCQVFSMVRCVHNNWASQAS